MSNDDLIKKVDIQKIAEAGAKIYEGIKQQYEPSENGKFLAVDIGSKQVFLGNTSSQAVELARKAHPNKVFYVVKIGFSAAETLASLISKGTTIIGVGLLRRFGYALNMDVKYNSLFLEK